MSFKHTIKLSYFTTGGKWKYDAEVEITLPGEIDAIHLIWEMLDNRQVAAPGLKGRWAGPILVRVPTHPHDHAHLCIVPVNCNPQLTPQGEHTWTSST